MTIIGCECVLPRPNVLQHTPPEIVKTMFHEAAQGKNYMNALDFATFLEKVQGQKGLDEHQVASLVTQTVLSAIAGFHFSISVQSVQLDLLGFSNYLVNAKLNPPISDTDIPTHDMTRPLSHYYIYASHNSYLTGNQLTSSSSIVPIIEALRNGCRVIELDCWEKQGQQCWSGSTNNDIVVLHGNTLTSAIPFKDCVIAIKENAFIASQYPVIITIENHMGAEMQKKAALVLREILGESLFYPSREQRPPLQFESPEVLKGFIIVSDQPPSDTIEDQLAVDPNAAQVLATDELDDAHASTSDHTRHAQRLKKHIKRAHKKAVLRVANTAAKVLRKSLLVEKIEVPETVEFQELIYLYCAKPSEMKKAKHEEGPLVGGDRAIMANLSEPQLQHFIARHPGSLIEYSKMNLGRVYPFGLRFNSSNADPMLAWSHGFQIAALNLQGRDRPVWLAKGFFQVNGHTGYVKKPDIFLPGFSLSHEDILNLPIKMILRVTVLLGTNWHRNFDFFKNPDFYVKVAVHGVKNDASKRQTQVIYNCIEPHWEHEHFEFPLRVPEIAVLRLECWEWDMGNHDFVGQACLPVRELRYGIRSVALRSKSGASRSSKLLCHFQSFAVSSLAPPSELPHPHPGPPSSQPPPPPPSLVFEELQSPPPLSFPAPEEPQSPPPLPPPVAPEEPQPPPPSLPPAPEESQSSSPPPPRPAPEEPQPMPRPSPLA